MVGPAWDGRRGRAQNRKKFVLKTEKPGCSNPQARDYQTHTCLGSRLSHTFYSPARVFVDGRGRVVATEAKGGPAAVMRCAGNPPDEWKEG